TVYGEPEYLPYDESHPTKPVNPYGQSKLQVEKILSDLASSDPEFIIVSLRYFNPVGAHDSGLIGEDPNGTPNNLIPYIAKVALGEIPYLNVFGDDYETKDGTGERDYIHVVDLAEGHSTALNFLKKNQGYHVFNLGSGQAISVLNVLRCFSKNSGINVPYQFTSRRLGDLPTYYADPKKAKIKLGWKTVKTLDEICFSAWRWHHLGKKLTGFYE
ncbi:GDP-mannose 4,6-dehydratase, partial [Flavobacterium sp.]|uniref:GDP-mannose 4,6-dehydratase n=1 Tax=Flavobacterium sp. TaxID=239 RepID=UPI0037C0B5EA